MLGRLIVVAFVLRPEAERPCHIRMTGRPKGPVSIVSATARPTVVSAAVPGAQLADVTEKGSVKPDVPPATSSVKIASSR